MTYFTPYIIIYSLSLVLLLGISIYAYARRRHLDEMHGMMVGMTLGMSAGLITATLLVIPTGNFLWGFILGSVMGLIFGLPLGKLGGHLGIVEGAVAGPMGGMMGAMLGQMIRPFSLEIFMPFFLFVFLLTLGGMAYALNCRMRNVAPILVPALGLTLDEEHESKRKKRVNGWMWGGALLAVALLGLGIIFPFSLEEKKNSISSAKTISTSPSLPPFLQELAKEVKEEAIIKGNYQEIELNITGSKYLPNVIVARKSILLKILVRAEENAGCAREIIFPDFGVDEIIPAGGSKVIEILPEKTGTYPFRCSMDMIHGKLIVVE